MSVTRSIYLPYLSRLPPTVGNYVTVYDVKLELRMIGEMDWFRRLMDLVLSSSFGTR